MKIDRLIGMLTLLLQKDWVTAPELAEKFEVSRRTINRDIEDLGKAGIPVVTRQGAGGGISIMEGFKLDRTLLSKRDLQDILAGLRSLDSVNGSAHYEQLMEKLSVGSSDFLTGDQTILIDLSSWYKETLAPKIELIRMAIEEERVLCFRYFSASSEGQREVEPYFLIFRWASWYLWGWCQKRKDYRLFKLNRMEELFMAQHSFKKRDVKIPDLNNDRIFPANIKVKALFDADCKWRLIEEFGSDSFVEQADKKLLFQFNYSDQDNLISWLMTFQDKVTLIEPVAIREKIKAIIGRMQKNY
ncbi:MAG: helix-turn-helix transcriptional regulator [Eubacteriaceae bacterium]|jgi:predicted DNA-binding transcriptional regulator YafY